MSHNTQHVPSYYAATVNDRTAYPRLEGQVRADVCVVGAGYTGVSAALDLAERGYSVALLEAHRIGWGASGRNGGQLIGGFAESGKIERRLGKEAAKLAQRLGVECMDIVRGRIAQFDIQCDLKWGFFDAAMKPRELKELHERKARLEARGYPHGLELADRESIRAFVGSDRYLGGLLDGGHGHLHPLNLCLGEARGAAGLGVQIFERSPVIELRRGATPEVRTEGGSVRADFVVLAGNAYLEGVARELDGMVLPAGSYIIATEPLPEALARELLPKDTAVCDQRVALDYFRLSADRRLLFGGLCNYSGRHPRSISSSLRPKMVRVFPQLANTRIEYEWGGYIGISLKRIPQLGRLDGNVYYAQGYSGHGVAPTHLAGRLVAEAIAGQAERFDVFAKVRHWKLPGGKWLASPALALGMLYYRLRDLL